jgi:dihydrodipicolinate synthase/N-acetylneuraminate lyase
LNTSSQRVNSGTSYAVILSEKDKVDGLYVNGSTGFDEMLLPATVLGIDGAIGSTFNINGHRTKQIFVLNLSIQAIDFKL